MIPLPYRMIFAVATKSSVYLYDTQQKSPFGLISNIHYTRLTDISWSGDGKILIVSSTDGFCSLISFTEGELGEVYVAEVDEIGGVVKESTPTKKATASKQRTKNGKDDEKEKKLDNADRKRDESIDAGKKSKDEKLAQPIAFRRKPKESDTQPSTEKEVKATPIEIKRTPKEQDKPPQPIAIKRKPKETDDLSPIKAKEEESRKRPRSNSAEKDDPSELSNPIAIRRVALETGDSKNGIIVKEIPPATTLFEKVVQPAKEIIIEAQKIISSEEKFESPCKASRPATPIAIRRRPRTPESVVSSGTPDKEATATPNNNRTATPIAIKRQPRSLLPSSSTLKVSIEEDDAVDTWPIDEPKPTAKIVNSSPGECEQTEDIKLVISDDEDDQPASKEDSGDSTVVTTPKTPRRVEFRTLSTPKSKKKLL